jgi:hypothetical protein
MTTHQMEIALRVLRAINKGENPSAVDVALLRSCLSDDQDRQPDELARTAIQDALRERKERARAQKS